MLIKMDLYIQSIEIEGARRFVYRKLRTNKLYHKKMVTLKTKLNNIRNTPLYQNCTK